jgi:2,4-dienoyl-CoA reductase (NADPH2)
LDSMGKDIGRSTCWVMMQDMARSLVEARVKTRALEITPNGIRVEFDGKVKEIRADTIVMAAGAKSHNPLQGKPEQRGIACQVVGDARKIALAFDAVHQGFLAGSAV